MKVQLQEWSKLLLTYKFALEEVSTKLKILNEELQFIHNYNPIEHIKTRIKNPESIQAKLVRKGYAITAENAKSLVKDIAGVRVICSFTSDIYHVFEMLSRQSDILVKEVKDYVHNPKPNGYQSLHAIIEIPVFLTDRIEHVLVEVQIRTIAMDFWASLEHKIYYKYQERVPCHIQERLKETADMISSLDRRMYELNEEVQQFKLN
ncbi:MAG: pyrophosphokinae [Paenibacillaceae bacterium]|jgi:putative GTP pyrophosphokinase|nr:pyrophosphokinae [Paenibacillaceae bacterium]